MKTTWPKVRLGELLTHFQEYIEEPEPKMYPKLSVKLYGKGVTLDTAADGMSLKMKRHQLAKAGQVILSEIWGKKGALGLVPPEGDGALCTSHFFLFNVRPEMVDPKWLQAIFDANYLEGQLDAESKGTTGYAAVRPKILLGCEIPLPPLAEQRRIVGRLEPLASKIAEARSLRDQAAKEANLLLASEERRLWPEEALAGARTLESVTVYLARGRQSEQGESEHFLIKTQHVQQGRHVPSMIRLAFHAAHKVKPAAIVQDGDILIACSAAGCLGRVARYRNEGRIASTDTHVAIARADSSLVDADYLYAYLRGEQGQRQLRSRERGDWKREKIGFRLTELNLNDLRQVPVPLPPFPEQRRITTYLDGLREKVDTLKRVQGETTSELDSLLPSMLTCAFNGLL